MQIRLGNNYCFARSIDTVMEEAPNTSISEDLDDPTLPYSRRAIELLQRGARTSEFESGEGPLRLTVVENPPAKPVVESLPVPPLAPAETEDEWFEFAGRRIRVSLSALDHIGFAGTIASMVTSGQSSCIFGVIDPDNFRDHEREEEREDDAPSVHSARLTAAHSNEVLPSDETPAESDEILDFQLAKRRRVLGSLVGALGLALMFGLPRLLDLDADASREDVEDVDAESTVPTLDGEPASNSLAADAEPSPPSVVEPTVDSAPGPVPIDKNRAEAGTAACSKQRQDAAAALRDGQWTRLDTLASRPKCWLKPSEPKALRMRALFELERYDACIELGEGDRSKEVKKWQKNCSRAQQ